MATITVESTGYMWMIDRVGTIRCSEERPEPFTVRPIKYAALLAIDIENMNVINAGTIKHMVTIETSYGVYKLRITPYHDGARWAYVTVVDDDDNAVYKIEL